MFKKKTIFHKKIKQKTFFKNIPCFGQIPKLAEMRIRKKVG